MQVVNECFPSKVEIVVTPHDLIFSQGKRKIIRLFGSCLLIKLTARQMYIKIDHKSRAEQLIENSSAKDQLIFNCQF